MRDSNSDDERIASSSRRNFLSASGFAAASTLGIGRLGSNPRMKRVPKYYKQGEVVKWMEVPRKWEHHRQRARNVLRRFNRDHLGGVHAGVLQTGLKRSGRRFGGKNGLDIVVTRNTKEPKPSLPDQVSGIPVQIEEMAGDLYGRQGCNAGNYDKYRGGAAAIDSLAEDRSGTAGFRVTDDDGNEYMISAAHVFGSCTIEDPDAVYQQDEKLGRIIGGDVKADFVAFDDRENKGEIRDEILEPDGTASGTVRQIRGGAGQQEIDSRASDLFDGHTKVGVSTLKDTGGIQKSGVTVDSHECITLRGEGIEAGTKGGTGDSGGPYYSVNSDGEAFVLGHHSLGKGQTSPESSCGIDYTERPESIGLAYYWFENNTTYRI